MKLSRGLAATLVLPALVLGGAALAPAQAQEYRLQGAIIAPPDNLWSRVGARFAEAVEERTDGRVVVDMSYSGELGNARETIEALQFETVHFVIQEVGQLDGYDALAGLGSYPYLIHDIDHFRAAMYDGDVGAEFHDELEERTGFKLVGAGFRGPRQMASAREVNTPDDLSGLKMRVPGQHIFRATWETLGANPVPMPSLEVYTALQQGIIDACENPLEAHVRSRYYEAVPYIILTGHVNAYYTFIFNSPTFAGLPEDVQEILREEGEKAMQWGTDETVKLIAEYRAALEEAGATFVEPDVEAFRAKLEPLRDEQPEDFQEWIGRFQAVAEAG